MRNSHDRSPRGGGEGGVIARAAPLVAPLVRTMNGAGGAILRVYGTDFQVDLKDDASPLTRADREAHGIITEALARLACPGWFETPLPVLSEEGRGIPYEERSEWGLYWLVDPLDGTKEFVSRNGEFTVNVALIEGTRPVLGLVSVPVRDVVYWGVPGEGAFKLEGAGGAGEGSDSPVQAARALAPVDPLPSSGGLVRVVGSRSHSGEGFERYMDELRKRFSDVEVVYAGSAVKFCLVAEGRADVYPRVGRTMEWDTAAGQAVAAGVGKRTYSLTTGEELRYNKPELANDPFVCR